MKKLLLVLSFIVVAAMSTKVNAQPYKSAAGLNFGTILGVDYKHFLSDRGAVDLVFGYQYPQKGIMLTGVYQYHFLLAQSFYMYVGAGANIGVKNLGKDRDSKFVLGLDPTAGFEYSFSGSPVALAIDYTPQINLVTSSNFGVAAFKIRFAFR